jgi:hypothetical protein
LFSLVAAVLDVMIYLQDSKPNDVEDIPPPAAEKAAQSGEEPRAESKADIRPVPESLSKRLPAVV